MENIEYESAKRDILLVRNSIFSSLNKRILSSYAFIWSPPKHPFHLKQNQRPAIDSLRVDFPVGEFTINLDKTKTEDGLLIKSQELRLSQTLRRMSEVTIRQENKLRYINSAIAILKENSMYDVISFSARVKFVEKDLILHILDIRTNCIGENYDIFIKANNKSDFLIAVNEFDLETKL